MVKTRKKLLFIINPISGGKEKSNFEKRSAQFLDTTLFDAQYRFTEKPDHAAELAQKAIQDNYDVVVAVGGDGTINEVARTLVNTPVVLGIVPEGSGNGLAGYLEIPMVMKEAILLLNKFRVKQIDSGKLNDHYFFNMAGIGFDAVISDRFDKDSIRGPFGYMKTVVSEIGNYKAENYRFVIDGKDYEEEAFMSSLANSPQYGNHAYVPPNASVSDGLLDVCIVKPFPLFLLPKMLFHLFSRTTDKSGFVDIIRGKEILIKREKEGYVHVDGQPICLGKELNCSILPDSLYIIY